ncbi:MAG: hypothetical protein MI748_02090 [Opitutales bacterium]|nr:hypothetical protein [Opitutales bacterium]
MPSIKKLVSQVKKNPNDVRFSELCRICDHYFGDPRQTGGSHRIYKMPWKGDPRVNIQDNKGKSKVYQTKQVLKAIGKLEEQNEFKNK